MERDTIAETWREGIRPDHRAGPRPRVIKRYANRKLYDTFVSRYVTLDDIAEMIRGGVEVRVLENETLRDLTSVTLDHVVSVEARRRSEDSAGTLRDLIHQGWPRSHPAEGGPEARTHRAAPGHRVDALLSQAHREAHSVRQMVAAAQASLCRMQASVEEQVDRAHDVANGFGKLKNELVRFSRRLDHLHERLRELDLGDVPRQEGQRPMGPAPLTVPIDRSAPTPT